MNMPVPEPGEIPMVTGLGVGYPPARAPDRRQAMVRRPAASREHELLIAIALHGGEAERSAEMYFALEGKEREALKSFLRSLTAPQ